MPTKYEVGNVYDLAEQCPQCSGTGYQWLGDSLKWRACQYCRTGYKVRYCEYCHGNGCEMCVGTKHTFYNELAATAPSYSPPQTDHRSFAGESTPRPARTIFKR